MISENELNIKYWNKYLLKYFIRMDWEKYYVLKELLVNLLKEWI